MELALFKLALYNIAPNSVISIFCYIFAGNILALVNSLSGKTGNCKDK